LTLKTSIPGEMSYMQRNGEDLLVGLMRVLGMQKAWVTIIALDRTSRHTRSR